MWSSVTMGSLKNLSDHTTEDCCSAVVIENPHVADHGHWNPGDGQKSANNSHTDKLNQALGSSEVTVTSEVSDSAEQELVQEDKTDLGPKTSGLVMGMSSAPSTSNSHPEVDLARENITPKEKPVGIVHCTQLKRDVSQEITILVTSHDNSLPAEENEGDFHSGQESASCSEHGRRRDNTSIDGTIVLASVITINELDRSKIIGSDSMMNADVSGQQLQSHSNCQKNMNASQQDGAQKRDTNSSAFDPMGISVSSRDIDEADSGPVNRASKTLFEQNVVQQLNKDHEFKDNPLNTETKDQSPCNPQHMQTQVSLEVTYQSVATSPMTPSDSATAFQFPYSLKNTGGNVTMDTSKAPDKDNLKILCHSVATSPMTPPGGAVTFLFPHSLSKPCGPGSDQVGHMEMKDGKLQVMCYSTATSPMTPAEGVSAFLYPQSLATASVIGPEDATPVQTKGTSLGVVCHSAATSPMMPPDGTAAFLFPQTMANVGDKASAEVTQEETKDSKLQVMCYSVATSPFIFPEGVASFFFPQSMVKAGVRSTGESNEGDNKESSLQVTSHSVATSPMTPVNSASAFAFPQSLSKTSVSSPEDVGKGETQDNRLQVICYSIATSPMMTPDSATAFQFPQPLNKSGSKCSEDPNQEDAKDGRLHVICHSVATSPMTPPDGPMAFHFPISLAKAGSRGPEDVVMCYSAATSPMTPPEGTPAFLFPYSMATSVVRSPEQLETKATKLEVTCHSVATSPMTPPDGAAAFQYPQSMLAKCVVRNTEDVIRVESTDGRLRVTCHSVATSPMTPPDSAMAFQFPQFLSSPGDKTSAEVTRVGNKYHGLQVTSQVEFQSVATSPTIPIGLTTPGILSEPQPTTEDGPNESPEPVQEVSWDEKGMTWEVYGAVVDVTVLGSAIQKHLEKQVKKHWKQPPSATSSPPLNQEAPQTPGPSSSPPISEALLTGSVKQSSAKKKEEKQFRKRRGVRRNPLRGIFQRIHRPHCCSSSRSEE
ncbi:uncharacterized protein gprin1 [Denticeps clupeoides]|uniref:G protein-regulated inducer of neurite outgrowth C-terminal domain-containing protein n=1 Tax=Denticeps clupeoides TaxID=299321 RepID=A0AAY4E778_9TELE|nr:uncharacterized protein LOC114768280 [Denticeps clupeoides]